ncbi:MAG TPA: cell division protein FtsQ/DivIB [Lichenihabitans sp.]|jgi:cell division protein FtsQ|nr:cell division protein FtsQ/DivIB [Lichenihabitans sp.]
MDGGGRLLRSIGGAGSGFLAEAHPRFASPFAVLSGKIAPAPPSQSRQRPAAGLSETIGTPRPGWGIALGLLLFGAVGLFGAVRGGEYATFVAQNGSPGDVVAKALGFSIRTIAISGLKELTPREILAGGGISPKLSLALLDPAALRERLRAIPLVKDVTIAKLFPHDLSISVTEREPVALWQNEGQVSLIAGDGVPIDAVHDDRFNALPFVVGADANARLDEYQALLKAAGSLQDKIRAGVLVGDRRWTLRMDSGIEVDLPEIGAAEAMTRLADIETRYRILEKDVVSVDLRIPGRITTRLSEDAAAQRAAALAKKPKAKANPA